MTDTTAAIADLARKHGLRVVRLDYQDVSAELRALDLDWYPKYHVLPVDTNAPGPQVGRRRREFNTLDEVLAYLEGL